MTIAHISRGVTGTVAPVSQRPSYDACLVDCHMHVMSSLGTPVPLMWHSVADVNLSQADMAVLAFLLRGLAPAILPGLALPLGLPKAGRFLSIGRRSTG